jgi:superfamily II helicase
MSSAVRPFAALSFHQGLLVILRDSGHAVFLVLDEIETLQRVRSDAREKELVFCDSRRRVEELGVALRARGVETFLSHSSLSCKQRHAA